MEPLKINNYTDLIFQVTPLRFIFWAGTQFVEDEGRLHSLPSSYLEGHFYK